MRVAMYAMGGPMKARTVPQVCVADDEWVIQELLRTGALLRVLCRNRTGGYPSTGQIQLDHTTSTPQRCHRMKDCVWMLALYRFQAQADEVEELGREGVVFG